jgi:hypothetical protein
MPKHSRPDVQRVDLYLPPELVAAIDGKAGAGGRNAWIAMTLARAAGVRLRAAQLSPRRGRPPKKSPQPSPQPNLPPAATV